MNRYQKPEDWSSILIASTADEVAKNRRSRVAREAARKALSDERQAKAIDKRARKAALRLKALR